jgi:histidyl-tRNA synthetase
MSKLSTNPYKGARDFYPEDKRLQRYLFGVMRSVCERYGYEEYDAPLLEPTDLYLQKGNEEIINEQTYTFKDRGDRSVTLRTEMTPSVARMVAGKRQELGCPLRWYSIPQCWRYERMQRGRGREFYQLNVDIFGDDSIAAEHEVLLLTADLMSAYGATQDMYEIRVSSRAFLNHVLTDKLGLSPTVQKDVTSLIDKSEKMDQADFRAKLSALVKDEGGAEVLENILAATDISALPDELQDNSSLREVKELLSACQQAGLQNVRYDASITRGFDYYTDIVFEVFDTHPDNNRSMFGGGRYDNLIGEFRVEPVPTVGFGMGDLTLQNFLELHDLLPDLATETDLYVAVLGDTYKAALDIVSELRQQNLNVALDALDRKPEKAIKTAEKKGIEHVLFIGQNELDSGEFSLRNIVNGTETKGDLETISQQLLSR